MAHCDDAKTDEPKDRIANDDGEDGAEETVGLKNENAGGQNGQTRPAG